MLWFSVGTGCVPTDTDLRPDPDDEDPGPDDTSVEPEDTDEPLPDPDPECQGVVLSFGVVDPWGRDLSRASTTTPSAGRFRVSGRPAWWSDDWDGPETLSASASDHHDGQLSVDWNGDFEVTQLDARSRWAVTVDVAEVEAGLSCEVRTLWLGLDHQWFAPSARPPSPNRASVLFDGEEGWAAAADLLDAAEQRVTWSTWYWESDFELVRPPGHASMDEAERAENTVLARFEALRGVDRRVLINRFWGENLDYTAYINTDSALRSYASRSGDAFEVMLQGNDVSVPIDDTFDEVPPPFPFLDRVVANHAGERAHEADLPSNQRGWWAVDAASWHQKGIVVDGARALVTGMNTKSSDWDTSRHDVYDERRMPFDADEGDRLDVLVGEEPAWNGPRKDYSALVEGPAAADVEAYFLARWADARADGVLYAEASTALPALPRPADVSGGVPVQVVATMPAPRLEQSVLETHLRAIEQATEYVLIEDQYFRAPILADALEARMWDEPGLVLLVITNEVGSLDPGLQWTVDNDQRFRVFGDRYLTVQLVATDLYLDVGVIWDTVELVEQPIFTHSKLRLVDDRYTSVGSCNWNNRGYKYEGELDVAILDAGVTRGVRRRVLEEIVGPAWAPYLSDDMQNNLDVVRVAAADNEDIAAWWRDDGEDLDVDEAIDLWADYAPSGWVFPLEFGDDWTIDVGPDAF